MISKEDFMLHLEGRRKAKVKPNILHSIDFQRTKFPELKLEHIENGSASIHWEMKVAKECAEKVDADLLEWLYEQYKNTDCDKVIILDKSQFKEFILRYLPIYLKEVQGE